jgi:hypothetical protein
LLNKSIDPFERKYHIVLATFLVFIDAGEDSIMANDVVTPSNPLVALVEKEELEETPLNVNVSQRLRDEDLFQRVVCTQVDRSTWDRKLSHNPHTFAIYFEFVPASRVIPKRFKKCQCENNDVCLHCQTWVPDDSHYCWLRSPINPLPMEHQAEYLARIIHCLLDFMQLSIFKKSCSLNYNSLEATQTEMLGSKSDFDSI